MFTAILRFRRETATAQLRSIGHALTVLAVFLPSSVSLAQDPLDLRRERRKIKEAEVAKAKAESKIQRLSLIEEAFRIREREKQEAKDERENVERQKQQVHYRNEVRRWALGGYEAGRRGLLPHVEGLDHRVRGWEKNKDQWMHIFLQLPEKSAGAIRSGRALNTFLLALGEAAMSHESFREKLRDDLALLTSEAETCRLALMSGSPAERDKAEQSLARIAAVRANVEIRQEVLASVGGRDALTPYHRSRIRFARQGIGSQVIIDPEAGALPLHWPSLLLRNSKYGNYLKAIELAREAALSELESGMGVTPATQRDLTSAVDDLWYLYKEDYDYFIQRNRSSIEKGTGVSQDFLETKLYLRGLKASVGRFLAARTLSDVGMDSKFTGTTIDSLLAHMARNGLQFPKADDNSVDTYRVLYQELVDYYFRLNSLILSIEYDEERQQELTVREQELFDKQFGNTMEELTAALKAAPPSEFGEAFADIGRGVRDLAEGVRDLKDVLDEIRGKSP